MPNPLVSAVITSYNRAAYLREAVASVLNQSFADYEIIIVDDGSTDDAPQVGREYADKHENVFFIAQENAGVAAARNTGVNKARGEFIAFLDDDDISHRDRFKKQVELLLNNNEYSACASKCSYIDETSKIIHSKKARRSTSAHTQSPLMIKREVYLNLGGQRPYFRVGEDTDFLMLFSENNYKYYVINDFLYSIRKYRTKIDLHLGNTYPIEKLEYIVAVHISAHCRRTGKPDPVEQNMPIEELQQRGGELPADIRLRLLNKARNAGRRLLARGEASKDNMSRIREYIDMLGHGECRDKAKKCCRWLIWLSLRYRQFSHIRLFFN